MLWPLLSFFGILFIAVLSAGAVVVLDGVVLAAVESNAIYSLIVPVLVAVAVGFYCNFYRVLNPFHIQYLIVIFQGAGFP